MLRGVCHCVRGLSQDISMLLWSLAQFQYDPASRYGQLIVATVDRNVRERRLTARSLPVIMWALARLRWRIPRAVRRHMHALVALILHLSDSHTLTRTHARRLFYTFARTAMEDTTRGEETHLHDHVCKDTCIHVQSRFTRRHAHAHARILGGIQRAVRSRIRSWATACARMHILRSLP